MLLSPREFGFGEPEELVGGCVMLVRAREERRVMAESAIVSEDSLEENIKSQERFEVEIKKNGN